MARGKRAGIYSKFLSTVARDLKQPVLPSLASLCLSLPLSFYFFHIFLLSSSPLFLSFPHITSFITSSLLRHVTYEPQKRKMKSWSA